MKNHFTLRFLFLTCLTLGTFASSAQKLTFKVIRSDDWKAIDQVKIKSSFHGILYNAANGSFELGYKDHDTLTLSKDGFHTIMYIIEAKNFDTAHTISLTMTPLAKGEIAKTNTSDINNLQKFDYHFVNDNPQDSSYVKIHALESIPSNQTRIGYQKEFKIGTVPLDHTTVEHKGNTKSDYKLK